MWGPLVPYTQCLVVFVSQLEVEDPRQRKINLGGLNAGRRVKTKVKLVNLSTIDLTFKLLLDTQLDLRVNNTHTHTQLFL